MCDTEHPVVKLGPDDSLIRIEESSQKKIKFVLEEVLKSDNKIDVICYYIQSANIETCNVVNSFALRFFDSKVIKTLLWVLKNKNHGYIITETMKALFAYNNKDVDDRIKKIIDKRSLDNPNFDRGGELANLMDKKPRSYKFKEENEKNSLNLRYYQ